jgi:hypothetical protein
LSNRLEIETAKMNLTEVSRKRSLLDFEKAYAKKFINKQRIHKSTRYRRYGHINNSRGEVQKKKSREELEARQNDMTANYIYNM